MLKKIPELFFKKKILSLEEIIKLPEKERLKEAKILFDYQFKKDDFDNAFETAKLISDTNFRSKALEMIVKKLIEKKHIWKARRITRGILENKY